MIVLTSLMIFAFAAGSIFSSLTVKMVFSLGFSCSRKVTKIRQEVVSNDRMIDSCRVNGEDMRQEIGLDGSFRNSPQPVPPPLPLQPLHPRQPLVQQTLASLLL